MKKLFYLLILFFLFSLPNYLLAEYVPTKGFVIKKVNVRRKPKKKSKVIYVFKKNTKLKIKKVSKRKKWYKVSNGKKVGWVTSKKVQVTDGYYNNVVITKEQSRELDRDLDESLGRLMFTFPTNKNIINSSDKSIIMDESIISSVESSPDDFEPVDVTEGFDALFMSLANENNNEDESENENNNEDESENENGSNTNTDGTTDSDNTDSSSSDESGETNLD